MLGIQQVTKKKSETCFGTCAVFTGWAKIEEKSSRHLPDASIPVSSVLLHKPQRMRGGEEKMTGHDLRSRESELDTKTGRAAIRPNGRAKSALR